MDKIYSLLCEKQKGEPKLTYSSTPAHQSKTEIELKHYNKPAELMK